MVNIITIGGKPGSGKTILSLEFVNKKKGCYYISTDKIIVDTFGEFIKKNDKGTYMHISTFLLTENFEIQKFLDNLLLNIEHILNNENFVSTIIIEGEFLHLNEDIVISFIKNKYSLYNFYPIQILGALDNKSYEAIFNDEKYYLEDYNHNTLVNAVNDKIKNDCLELIRDKNHYQTFDMFDDSEGISPTYKRFKQSKIIREIGMFNNILDVGCNSGYFCFKMADKTRGHVYGLDVHKEFTDIGKRLNNSFFKQEKTHFINKNIFEFKTEVIFDIIHCSSTFHYFNEKQIDFLKIVYKLLNNKGVFLLEVELCDYDDNANPFIDTETIKEGNDRPLFYPNLNYFKNMISDLYRIEDSFKSIDQPGSVYDRYYFRLMKK